MRILLASNNLGKVKEYLDILSPRGIEILTMKDLGIKIDVEENGKTYEENAFIKAKALRPYTDLPIVADDSGLEVLELDGFPGLFTARFASSLGGYPNAFDELNKRLEGKKKDARFVCHIACLPEKSEEAHFFEGICEGLILDKEVGENGFGYDPIFFSKELNKPFGTLDEETKNRYSHRGKAAAKLLDFLSKGL